MAIESPATASYPAPDQVDGPLIADRSDSWIGPKSIGIDSDRDEESDVPEVRVRCLLWLLMMGATPAVNGLASNSAIVPGSAYAAARDAQRPSPHPYDTIYQQADWVSPKGRRLAFCLLGLRGEERARTLAVYEWSDDEKRGGGVGWVPLFIDSDRGFRPWSLALAELDGDALPEIAVGTYKQTRFDPVERNRLFIFDWTSTDVLYPKWLGSRVGKFPLTAFRFVHEADGLDRLQCLESDDGQLEWRQYQWTGFGFCEEADLEGASESDALNDGGEGRRE
jgi:hypothetical protein